jgi:diguanylate cyclase (GGDEF)-like protein
MNYIEMRSTDKTLIEQLKMSEFHIENRKELFMITEEDAYLLRKAKPFIESKLNFLVDQFYEIQTSIPDISLLIGDLDTLNRLKEAQKSYIIDLFSGYYDVEYVNNRLRIGIVHKRIGVEPKLYLAANLLLKQLITQLINQSIPAEMGHEKILDAVEKLMLFDISLVFDTYIRSLVSEIEISRKRSEQYASSLEEKVRERTKQLEELSKTDALTGLLNRRQMDEILTRELRAAQRRNETIVLAYIDVNNFKKINDTKGHQYGDQVLCDIAMALKETCKPDDLCFRHGGDEFCIFLANTELEAVKNFWEKRLLQNLDKNDHSFTISIGYAQTDPEKFATLEKLLQHADEKMYEIKKRFRANKKN